MRVVCVLLNELTYRDVQGVRELLQNAELRTAALIGF
jgi:hypothetical protein